MSMRLPFACAPARGPFMTSIMGRIILQYLTMDAPKVFSYLRFSADIQSRGDSIRRQTQLARDYCDKNGLVLDDSLSFRDLGVSAYKGANAATGKLSLFLKSFEEGKVKQGDILLVRTSTRTGALASRHRTPPPRLTLEPPPTTGPPRLSTPRTPLQTAESPPSPSDETLPVDNSH
jgi:hypothetical protein